MRKRITLWMAPLAMLLTAGLLWAGDNTWLFPVPTLNGIKKGDLIYVFDPQNLGNISTDGVLPGQVLTSNGPGIQPTWGATGVSGAFMTVNTLTATGINTSTGKFSSLTASLPVFTNSLKELVSTGTVPVNQGGTNLTTYATGDLVLGATGTLGQLAAVAQGQMLVSAGANANPAWSATLATGIASPEKTDGTVFLPALEYCRSDLFQGLATQQLIPIRIAANSWVLQRSAALAETYNVTCSLNSFLQRTTANKGLKINNVSILYAITTANLTSHTWGKIATTAYATGAAVVVGSDLATGISGRAVKLETVNNGANTYVSIANITTPTYFPANASTGLTIEWGAVVPNTSVYSVIGLQVNYSRTDL